MELFERAREYGLPSDFDTELLFYAAGRQAFTKGKNPPALFIDLLKIGTLANVDDDVTRNSKALIVSNPDRFRRGLAEHVAGVDW